MGRNRTIDRDMVLDVAEQIVFRDGATALTFDAVAKAAGITKGGLQYCFGSKDDLIAAIVDRGAKVFEAELARNTPPDADSLDRARGYIRASKSIDEPSQARFVSVILLLLQSPEQKQKIREFYAEWITQLDPGSEVERRTRTALIAAEGAFLLRSLALVEMDQAGWDDVFEDILKALPPKQE
ncbi:TetR family transcriptional regulator [Rhodoblastus sphagnicola]|uniref:TetR family transcriptional regulator n=1 Tax=Rhodoblastus sphagnicola TaxID=333368 RepID=A0A2S6MVH3_9HYPH|nr:TetR/AcrR family transcriptional regulator [Rhodoblastus sphagnicola]MBB4197549.1 AcrR family transcriptional regulator [Rhodoblastus sphagnicola]PPQ26361.1 TetR family transcriptional regulator [Rhodoblastus sphagnicola]